MQICQQHGITVPTDINKAHNVAELLIRGMRQIQRHILRTHEYDPLSSASIIQHAKANCLTRDIRMFLPSQGYRVYFYSRSGVLCLETSVSVLLESVKTIDNLLKLGYCYVPPSNCKRGTSLFTELSESGAIRESKIF